MKWRPRGLTDALDGSNAFDGAMMSLANLCPAPSTAAGWVPRPAAATLTTLTGKGLLNTPTVVNGLLQIGNIVYGMAAETASTFSGKDVPFAYNVATNTFETITVPGGASSLPTTPSATGDWTAPTMAQVGSVIVITHPGYPGGGTKFGWLDISGFSSNTVTGNTHSNTTLDTLSTNVITAGWKVGMTISSSAGDIPANTTIKSIASNGLSLVLSAAATGTNAGVTLTVAGGTATAPLYGAGDTNLNNLAAVPVAVANFNGRAYFAVPANGAQFSDSLDPRTITNASQALKPGNGLDITAWGGLPVEQTTGGILQALIGFQGDSQMQQITGDPATNNLALNNMGVGVGTLAPNTICQTPEGLAFIAHDGLRMVTITGQVSPPVGANGQGVCVPFLNAVNPSRMCAAFNDNVLRVSVKNGNASGQPVQEYWLDFGLKVWSGPHTFPAALIQPFQGTPNHGFTMFASGVNATLFSSAVIPTASDTYTENGTLLSWTYQTVLLPDNDDASMNKMVVGTLTAAIAVQEQVNVQFLDESSAVIDSLILAGPVTGGTVWNAFKWGSAPWGGTNTFLYQHPLHWHFPIIFKQGSILVTGDSVIGNFIGNLNLQVEPLGYLTEATG